jgi:hypothetical protein
MSKLEKSRMHPIWPIFVSVAAFVVTAAQPVNASDTADTDLAFCVSVGDLSITAPSGPILIGSGGGSPPAANQLGHPYLLGGLGIADLIAALLLFRPHESRLAWRRRTDKQGGSGPAQPSADLRVFPADPFEPAYAGKVARAVRDRKEAIDG